VKRGFIAGALAVALAVVATASASRPRVVVLGPAEEPRFSDVMRGLGEGLAEHGRPRGSYELVDKRVRRGERAAAEAAVHEALRTRPDVLFVVGSVLARIARDADPDVPLVFITPGDPVLAGLAASLRKPGGNLTAVTFEYPELAAKRLEILKEIAPAARRVLVVYDPRDQSPVQGLAAVRAAAPKVGLEIVAAELRDAKAAARVVERARSVDGVLLIPGGTAFPAAADIMRAASARRLAVVAAHRRDVTLGAVAAYGASDVDAARDAARLVDRILRGARAGDLPIERPTKLRLILSRKNARALGLSLPDAVVVRADETVD
jgi:putative ABC transport system substrate-binding protein